MDARVGGVCLQEKAWLFIRRTTDRVFPGQGQEDSWMLGQGKTLVHENPESVWASLPPTSAHP